MSIAIDILRRHRDASAALHRSFLRAALASEAERELAYMSKLSDIIGEIEAADSTGQTEAA